MTTERVPVYGYDDYAAIDDGHRYQVLEGALIVTPSPSFRHQSLVLDLGALLRAHVRENRLGRVAIAPFDVILAEGRPGTILQPDILFVAAHRVQAFTSKGFEGAPDLVVEVLSPSNARLDTVGKLALYAKFGVPEVWFVPFEFERIEVLLRAVDGQYGDPQLYGRGQQLRSEALPGLELAIDTLFADVDES